MLGRMGTRMGKRRKDFYIKLPITIQKKYKMFYFWNVSTKGHWHRIISPSKPGRSLGWERRHREQKE